jgi:hypothetical protein
VVPVKPVVTFFGTTAVFLDGLTEVPPATGLLTIGGLLTTPAVLFDPVVVFGLLISLLTNAAVPAPAAVFNNVFVKELLGFVVVGFTTGVVGFTTGVVGFTVLVIGLIGGFTAGVTGLTGVTGFVTGLVTAVGLTAGLVTAAGFVAGFNVAAGLTVEVTGAFTGALAPVEVMGGAGLVLVAVVPETGRIALVPPATVWPEGAVG